VKEKKERLYSSSLIIEVLIIWRSYCYGRRTLKLVHMRLIARSIEFISIPRIHIVKKIVGADLA